MAIQSSKFWQGNLCCSPIQHPDHTLSSHYPASLLPADAASPQVGSRPQIPLLQNFQQIVELKESAKVLVDVAKQDANHQFTDLKEILETWRLRAPNDWESLLHWQDVLVWRNQIYNIVINAFRNMSEIAPQLHQLGYRDKAWSVNKLGAVATLHGSPDTCLSILNTMYGYNAMEVQVRGRKGPGARQEGVVLGAL